MNNLWEELEQKENQLFSIMVEHFERNYTSAFFSLHHNWQSTINLCQLMFTPIFIRTLRLDFFVLSVNSLLSKIFYLLIIPFIASEPFWFFIFTFNSNHLINFLGYMFLFIILPALICIELLAFTLSFITRPIFTIFFIIGFFLENLISNDFLRCDFLRCDFLRYLNFYSSIPEQLAYSGTNDIQDLLPLLEESINSGIEMGSNSIH